MLLSPSSGFNHQCEGHIPGANLDEAIGICGAGILGDVADLHVGPALGEDVDPDPLLVAELVVGPFYLHKFCLLLSRIPE